MKYRDREKHVCDQGQGGYMVMYRVYRKFDRLAQVRRVRHGVHHVMPSRSLRGKETTG